MGEASVAVGWLRRVALEATVRIAIGTLANSTIQILHAEKMRGDKRVPPEVR